MITEMVRPMKGAKTPTKEQILKLRSDNWPRYFSPKLDGIRAIVKNGVVVSYTLKPIRNAFVQNMFGRPEFEGLDGELIAGSPLDKNIFNKTTSAVMTIGSTEEVVFHVFDHFHPTEKFSQRLSNLERIVRNGASGSGRVSAYLEVVPQIPVYNWRDVEEQEEKHLIMGYEGGMLRSAEGPYKQGRSTLKEEYLIKLKRFQDGEAIVLDFEALQSNQNPEQRNALGLMKRSSSKEGMIAIDTLGKFIVKDVKTGAIFNVGSGLDDATRQLIWNNKETYRGRIITYTFMEYGTIDKPRSPIFKGFRDPDDFHL